MRQEGPVSSLATPNCGVALHTRRGRRTNPDAKQRVLLDLQPAAKVALVEALRLRGHAEVLHLFVVNLQDADADHVRAASLCLCLWEREGGNPRQSMSTRRSRTRRNEILGKCMRS